LEDDYFFNPRLKIKTTNASQLTWVTEGELNSKGASASISAIKKGPTLSLDKLRVKSDGRVLAEASLKTNQYTKFTVSAEDGRQEPGKPLQSFGKLGYELATSRLFVTGDVDVVNGPIVRTSMNYNYSSSVSAGGEVLVNTHFEEKGQSPQIADVNAGIAYKGPDWSLTARTFELFGNLRVYYLHNVSPKLTVGSQLDYRLKSNSQKFSIGGRYL
jgi:hypothetical protein